MNPELGFMRPPIKSPQVVLPEPEKPTNPTFCPFDIDKFKSFIINLDSLLYLKLTLSSFKKGKLSLCFFA